MYCALDHDAPFTGPNHTAAQSYPEYFSNWSSFNYKQFGLHLTLLALSSKLLYMRLLQPTHNYLSMLSSNLLNLTNIFRTLHLSGNREKGQRRCM